LSSCTISTSNILVSNSGYMRGGQTNYNVGTGFWIGDVSGTPKFSIGNSASNISLTWDGTKLVTANLQSPNYISTTTGFKLTAVDGLEINTGTIKVKSIEPAIAGDYLACYPDKADKSINPANYTKISEYYTARGGTYTTKMKFRTGVADKAAYAQVFKNGAAHGTERINTTVVVATYTENLVFAAGDLIQLYVHGTDGQYCRVTEFSIFVGNRVLEGLTVDWV